MRKKGKGTTGAQHLFLLKCHQLLVLRERSTEAEERGRLIRSVIG